MMLKNMKILVRVTLLAVAPLVLLEACKNNGQAQERVQTSNAAPTVAGRSGEEAEHAGVQTRGFTAEQIKTALSRHIRAEIVKGGGVFKIHDSKTKETLSLEFVKIHDPVRKIENKGYFACTDFHPTGTVKDKLYDLDFRLNPRDGKLVVTDTKIHKHPERQGADVEADRFLEMITEVR